MAGPLSDKDIKFMTNLPPKQRGMPGPISDKDIQFMQGAAPKGRKRKFVPGEIYSAKGKTGRN